MIVLLTILPHCSHRLQPLDRAVPGPFKKAYNTATDAWMTNHPSKSVTIYDIQTLVNEDSFNLDEEFRTFTFGKKCQNKRKRQGSLTVKSISLRTDPSSSPDSDTSQNTDYKTPSSNRSTSIHSTQHLKTLIVPIDKTKTLKNVTPQSKNVWDKHP